MPLASEARVRAAGLLDALARLKVRSSRRPQPAALSPARARSRPHERSNPSSRRATQDDAAATTSSRENPPATTTKKPPIPPASAPPPPCGLRSDVDWITSNRRALTLAAQKRRDEQAAEQRRRRRAGGDRPPPPPRALDGKIGSGATEFWLKHKPGYGQVPEFCVAGGAGGGGGGGGEGVGKSSKGAGAAGKAGAATAGGARTTTTTTTTPPPPTLLSDDERLALLARAKARHAALAAQYGRLPLCFAADTPSGLRRREALGRALDQAKQDAEALGAAARVVVVAWVEEDKKRVKKR
jgi:hypothetical protein